MSGYARPVKKMSGKENLRVKLKVHRAGKK